MAVVNLMEKLFEMIRGDVADLKVRMTGVETRLDRVENRLDRVEGRLEDVENRLDAVEIRLGRVEIGMIQIATELRAGFGQVIELLNDHGSRGRKLRDQVDDHESRIAALEADAPVGGRPPKH